MAEARSRAVRRPVSLPILPVVITRFLDAPEPVLRLEIIRVFAPLATLGFLSSRLAHVDEWLTDAGFQVPAMPIPDYRQPLYLPPLSSEAAHALAAVLVLSGLAVTLGVRARAAAFVFACTLAYVALADRLAAFTVSKLSPAVMFALAASPIGRRFGVDALFAGRRDPKAPVIRYVAGAGVRFFQVLLPVFYAGSAAAKIKGGWLREGAILYTHLHDSYQTAFSWFVLRVTPPFAYTVLQLIVLGLEAGAPLWFAWPKTRPYALLLAVVMHALIGAMFWPVRWFGLLMIVLWCGAYLPREWLERGERELTAMGRRLFGASTISAAGPKRKVRLKARATDAADT